MSEKKLSERIRNYGYIENEDRLTSLGDEVESLERDHEIAITELSELRTRIRHNMKNDGYGIECIDKVLGISEEAKP